MDDRRSAERPEQPRKFVDRRRKQDWVVRSVTIIAVLGWIGALIALLLIDRASPTDPFFLAGPNWLNETPSASYWNSSMLRSAFAAISVSFVVSILGFILNLTRHRRKTDRFNKLLIGIGIASIIILVIYLINFSKYL